MWEQKELNPEEKLEYIYNYVKTQKRNNKIHMIFKSFFYIFLIIYLLYSYFILWPKIKNDFIEPVLKPLWIKNFTVSEIKNFFEKVKNPKINIWTSENDEDIWINMDKDKFDKIKDILTK